MNEEYTLKCHEMAKALMREFRIAEYVSRLTRYPDERIKEYGRYYKQAYELFYMLGKLEMGQTQE